MAWENPVTTWGQAGKTVPGAGDFNRIEGNTQYLKDEVDSHKAENASTTAKGHVQLSSSTSSTSTSLAATASAVKTVNDALTSHMAEKATDTDLGHVKSDGVTTVVDANGKISMQTGIVSVSDNKTLALTDAFKVLNCTNSTAITITIPLNSAVAFSVGAEIAIIRSGAGTVTFAVTDGVTLSSSGSKKSIKAQHESVALKKTATDAWTLVGSLST